jgi:threonine/homoserine/homoserine lactone efflux protein
MIPQQEMLIAFVLTSIVVCLIPGPAVIFVVTHTISRGLKSGLGAVWGLQAGFFIQVLAATCGLSALILKSTTAFLVLKFLGSLYLIYLGGSLILRKGGDKQETSSLNGGKPLSSFTHGVLINALNPKIALFFVAYVPQFIDGTVGSSVGQVFFLGMVFCLLGTLSSILYAITAKAAASRFGNLLNSSVFNRWLPGAVFMGCGLKLAFSVWEPGDE